jgi:tRNA(fMet)-specific endonuclease VapC
VIYLLDSNVWIVLMRKPKPQVAARFKAVPPDDIRTCPMVVAELRYGAALSAKPAANRALVDGLVSPYPSLPFDDAAIDFFVSVRTHLKALGTPIGPYDLQIAAIALANDCTLVTHNLSEFGRVPGLTLEDWETP